MKRIILVSNRLPVTIEKEGNSFKITPSSGGLATGLSSVSKNYQCLWLGFPGIVSGDMTDQEKKEIEQSLLEKHNCYPVHLDYQEIKNYYNGFSNKTIWPLFHYFQYYTNYENKTWEYYKEVNQKFYEELIKIITQDDIVWIHDYQLMLLPELLKNKFPSIRVGFFLHIPFPSYEIFRQLPWDREILEGILGADFIGFHTFSYVRHFLSSVQQVLGYENTFGQINTGSRIIKVDAIPMGIDYNKFARSSADGNVKREQRIIQKDLRKQKVILSVDRLDYTKGLIERLEAIDLFFTNYPDYIGKVTLIMVAVPSRTKIDSYHSLKNRVDETIGRINGKFSRIGWTPIKYMYRSINFQTLSALYSLADVTLVTPIRDGMNLVAKEYIASITNKKGVLILSEMAGVSEELGEAIIVNPNNKDEIAAALDSALQMPPNEQANRIKSMQERLKRNDIFKWASLFIEKLEATKAIEEKFGSKILTDENKQTILLSYKQSKKRVFILDYDGTLTGFKNKIEDAKPDNELYQLLSNLCKDTRNSVVIISGRTRDNLDKFFSKYPITLVAEHGAWIKDLNKEWISLVNTNLEWKKDITPILQTYVDRTPKSFIEEKTFSLVWHYRNSDIDLASIRLKELKETLISIVANLNLGILDGKKVLEIKSLDINKGKTALDIINNNSYDFIIAIGDDVTDEDIFISMPKDAHTIKVGIKNSMARHNLRDYKEVRSLLKEFTQ